MSAVALVGGLVLAGMTTGTSSADVARSTASTGSGAVVALPATDFNGDGYVDLGIGVPYDDESGVRNAGGVNVLYGSESGITAAGSQHFTPRSEGLTGRVSKDSRWGESVAAGDFNGDGFTDLAAGAPIQDLGRIHQTGAVRVLYGSAAGLTAEGNQFWSPKKLSVPVYYGEHFGRRLAAGDFDGDGIADLAIANGPHDGGSPAAVYVLRGSSSGLLKQGKVILTRDHPVGTDPILPLASGDLDADGDDDLAWGRPYESPGGLVEVFDGGPGGLDPTVSRTWTQDSPGVLGVAGAGESFGRTLGIGDIDGDGYPDLAVMINADGLGEGTTSQPSIAVLFSSPKGLSADGDQRWYLEDQFRPDGPSFNYLPVVRVGDVSGDGFADVAVGFPSADLYNEIGEVIDGIGAAIVIRGSPSGLTLDGAREWTPDSDGIEGPTEEYVQFGAALHIGDYDGDGIGDLSIHSKGYGLPHKSSVGSIHVLPGSPDGPTTDGATLWTQDSPDVPGIARDGDYFGIALS